MKQKIFFFLFFSIYLFGAAFGQTPPAITINNNSNPSDGYIFLSNFVLDDDMETDPYLLIIDNNGRLVFKRYMNSSINTDFKLQKNGMFTYFSFARSRFYGMNSNFEVVDSFRAVNGKATNLHELKFLDDGGYILLAIENRIVDMSQIVEGGRPNAVVVGNVIQKFNAQKELVFEWNVFDHLNITDATEDIDLTTPVVECFHCNALDLDYDGNILLSVRYFDEIIKIDVETGDIIWRLGGSKSKNNEFEFLNDTDENNFTGFSHQHAIRLLPNGNYMLFDNGNLKTPQYSRALEFSLDQENKTFTKVWEYRPSPDVYTSAMGYAQRLENGNTIIGWGENHFTKTVTEVTPDGEVAFDLSLPFKIYSYRAFRFDVDITSIRDETNFAEKFRLYQNYPNPFGKSGAGSGTFTTIKYFVPLKNGESADVSLKVYDLLGRKIAELVNGKQTPGEHQVKFNSKKLPSGIYFYSLRSGKFFSVKKMLIIN
ncbi:MAG: T9SS type A sorting domain-containing protein [Chlorobi bacterium]|nr:T9SS type A sorting domain-containing protein [Chlorobiota bacterium]